MSRLLFSIIALLGGVEALAEERSVFLQADGGERIAVATMQTDADGSYELTMSETVFTNHFLSMRPFKCLEGPAKHWCYVPYPYPLARNVSTGATDLEYDLLFLWKGAGEYGIDMWNGVYYVIDEKPDGTLYGVMHEMDMNLLASPPPEGTRPLKDSDLHKADVDSHWLPHLVIE
ncbi:MAG: hypothetical protein AB8B58_06595 [Roseobacter sp.]